MHHGGRDFFIINWYFIENKGEITLRKGDL